MSRPETANDIDALLKEFEAGKITRDDFIAQMARPQPASPRPASLGAAAVGVNSRYTDKGRIVLLSRIMNHEYSVNSTTGKITLGEDGMFETAVDHQTWLFSSNSDSLDKYTADSTGAVTGTAGGQKGEPFDSDHSAYVANLVNLLADANTELDLFDEANYTNRSTDGAWPWNDLYGLIQAKLQWKCGHCTEAAIPEVLRFVRSVLTSDDNPDPICTQCIHQLFYSDEVSHTESGTDWVPDRSAKAWATLKNIFDKAGNPYPLNWEDIKDSFYKTDISFDSAHASY